MVTGDEEVGVMAVDGIYDRVVLVRTEEGRLVSQLIGVNVVVIVEVGLADVVISDVGVSIVVI